MKKNKSLISSEIYLLKKINSSKNGKNFTGKSNV